MKIAKHILPIIALAAITASCGSQKVAVPETQKVTTTTTTTTTTKTTTTTTTTTTEPVITKDIILGDINNDEVIDVYDVISLRKAVIVGSKSEELDLNGDKEVNIADLVKLQRYIQGHSDSDLSRRTINVRK